MALYTYGYSWRWINALISNDLIDIAIEWLLIHRFLLILGGLKCKI